MQPFKGGLTSVATAVSERALRYDIDDFFLVKGSLRRRSFSASFSVPPYMATCVAISMSVLISVFINCKGTRLLSHFSLHAIPYCLLSYIVVCWWSPRWAKDSENCENSENSGGNGGGLGLGGDRFFYTSGRGGEGEGLVGGSIE